MSDRWSKDGLKTGSTDARTFFETNGCTVYKSYAAIIGFTDRAGNSYITDGRWSQTTSKHQSHLAHMLGCSTRTPHEEFEKLYNDLVLTDRYNDNKDHAPMFS
jgi:hypothetical protein